MWNDTNSSTSTVQTTTENSSYYYDHYYDYYYFYDSYNWDYGEWMESVSVQKILKYCRSPDGLEAWLGFKIFILVTALPANSALLWLLFKSRHKLSPSQLLAFNISILNILYCLSIPLDIYDKHTPASDIFHHLNRSFLGVNMFGCPLFLTLMCLERYVAATFPLTYLRLGKRKHRIVLSALSWIATTCVSVLLYFFESFVTVLAFAAVISVFFLIMLLCLAGIVYVLCQSRPGDGANSSSDSQMKRALCNIIMVIVPSAVAYTPLVVVVCYLSVILSTDRKEYTKEQCTVLEFLLQFPNFGLYIGPLFYTSVIRQITCCCKREPGRTVSQTQPE